MYGSYHHPSHQQGASGHPQQDWNQPTDQAPYQGSQAWNQPDQSAGPSYNPGTYGPMPGGGSNFSVAGPGNVDTSQWGVRYNQAHQGSNTPTNATIPPPLPPRPSSSIEDNHSPAFSQAPNAGPAPWSPPVQTYTSPAPATTQEYQQHAYGAIYHDPNVQSHDTVPPPPPPLPPAYLSEQQQQQQQPSGWPQQPTYSHQPTTHHYDPQPMQQDHGYSTPAYHDTTSYNHPPTGAPVSAAYSVPVTVPPPQEQNYSGPPAHHFANAPPPPPATSATSNAPATSSALGAYGPSDWEHFTPHDTSGGGYTNSPFTVDTRPPPTSVAIPPSQHALSPPTVSPEPQPLPQQAQTGFSQHQQAPVSPIVETRQTDKIGSAHRVDSLDSTVSVSTAGDRSESIDGVIKAWSQPISPEGKAQIKERKSPAPDKQGSVSTLDQPAASISAPTGSNSKAIDSSQLNSPKVKSENPITITKVVDPYEDLEPWYRSSLMRYVAMLRKEAVAETDEERYDIFTAFVSKESKLREILYNIEPKPQASQTTDTSAVSGKPVSHRGTAQPVSSPPEKPESKEEGGQVTANLPSKQTAISKGDQFMENDGSYSPGGRPILSSIPRSDHTQQQSITQDLGKTRSSSTAPQPPHELSSGDNQPTNASNPLIRNTVTDYPRSPSAPVGLSAAESQNLGKTPAYVPFRYSEGPQRGSEKLVFEQPAYQAYSALRQASAESGRVMTQNAVQPHRERSGTVGSRPTTAGDGDETFLGLMREKSGVYRHRKGTSSPSPSSLPESLRLAKTSGIIAELRALVPTSTPDKSESLQNAALRRDMDKFPDSLEFAQEMIGVWDREAKSRREHLDEGRRTRQDESENRIDGLFNEKEIGYSDITTLEEEFRQKEAKAQLDEERKEFDSYVTNVFKPVEERLKRDVSSLKTKYETAIGLLDSETKSISRQGNNRLLRNSQLSYTMRNVVTIFQKLELRYEKLVEAALEQERRRKKTERRPLVFLGDSAALKRLDKDFESMERRNIHDAAKDRDERANRLMDSFDEATLTGLAENQSLLDDISAKVQKLDPSIIRSSGVDPAEIRQTLESASVTVNMLAADSESILYSFVLADRILNDADYEVSVVEARLSNSDAEVFRRLEVEKKKEDGKIQLELDSRLNGVKKGPKEISLKIEKILDAVDSMASFSPLPRAASSSPLPEPLVLPEPKPTPPPGPTPEEEQKERLRIALETAKKRNAAKGFS
ncbi:hypothetical protein FQN54_000590 [Arachnomyces sp. PD_36]|nr:hypothetical protein FQN54_000590 [Arachnomyces sp. PD_36]